MSTSGGSAESAETVAFAELQKKREAFWKAKEDDEGSKEEAKIEGSDETATEKEENGDESW